MCATMVTSVASNLRFLLPWLRLALLIREVRATTWNSSTWFTGEADAEGRDHDAGEDAAVGVVDLGGDRERAAGGMTRCGFCSKSTDDVRLILTRGESAICDECVLLAFDTIGAEKGQLYQRVAYSVFKIVAIVGRFFTFGRRSP